jgi:hypothetical protein
MSGTVTGAPNILLRLESLFVLIGATVAFAELGISWWYFAGLILLPDLSILGYLAGPKVGAIVYNTVHWYGLPFACIALGVFGHVPQVLAVGLIWAAHIGFDRALGFGLKSADGFGFTHLGSMGKARNAQ